MRIENEHNNAETILDEYLQGGLPPALQEIIQGWWVAAGSRQQRDEAFERAFDQWVAPDRRFSKEARRCYEDIRIRLGLPVKKTVSKRKRFGKLALKTAAVLVPFLIVCGVAFTWLNRPDGTALGTADQTTWVSNRYDQAGMIGLPDGSSVWVKEGTLLEFSEDFSNERIVRLKGEAFFSVTKQDGQRFQVQTPDMLVTVLGTEFNVRAYEDGDTEWVAVSSGLVEVAYGDEKARLEANTQLIYDTYAETASIEAFSPLTSMRWRNISLKIDEVPISEALAMVADYFGLNIEWRGSVRGNLLARAEFSADDTIDEVLEMLQFITEAFDYEIHADTVRIVAR